MIRQLVFLCRSMICVPLGAQDMPLTQVLIEGEGWELVSQGHQFTDGFAADSEGNFYFADVLGGTTINRVSLEGDVVAVVNDVPRISGLAFGREGSLFACQGGAFGRIIKIDLKSGEIHALAEGVKPNDLIVSSRGDIYFTQTPTKQVMRINPDGVLSVASESSKSDGPQRPNGIAISPGQGLLAVSDHGGRHTWVWRINQDGGLEYRQPYITLRTPKPDAASRGDGMTIDAVGRFYVTSAVGIQMFDPTGRMGGVILAPNEKSIVSVAFAGKDFSYLYVAAGDSVFRRKTKTSGFVVK